MNRQPRTPTLTTNARKCASFSKNVATLTPLYHRQTPRPINRPRDRSTNFTDRRNRQNSIHPYLPSTKPCNQKYSQKLQNPLKSSQNIHIFSLAPLISFKRDRNLGNFKVRRAFKFNILQGTFTCKCTRCKTCPFISHTVKI